MNGGGGATPFPLRDIVGCNFDPHSPYQSHAAKEVSAAQVSKTRFNQQLNSADREGVGFAFILQSLPLVSNSNHHPDRRGKHKKNRERDKRNRRELRKAGWKVFAIWECGIKILKNLVASLSKFLATCPIGG